MLPILDVEGSLREIEFSYDGSNFFARANGGAPMQIS